MLEHYSNLKLSYSSISTINPFAIYCNTSNLNVTVDYEFNIFPLFYICGVKLKY